MTIEELLKAELEFEWLPGARAKLWEDDDGGEKLVYVAHHGGHEIRLVLGDFPDTAMWLIYVDGRLAKQVDGYPHTWKIVKENPEFTTPLARFKRSSCCLLRVLIPLLIIYVIIERLITGDWLWK